MHKESFRMNTLFLAIQIGLSTVTALHALIYKRDSRSAISWIAVCFLVPYLGALFYYAFGINSVAYKAKVLANKDTNAHRLSFHNFQSQLRANTSLKQSMSIPQQHINNKFGKVSQHVEPTLWTDGNTIQTLVNGDETYPAMLKAIVNAKQCIYLMTYIFHTDKFGKQLIEALKKAQERGVEVKVIIDGIAYMYSLPTASSLLNKAGIDNLKFNTTSLFPPSFGINLRNHKKLLLIDSDIVFTGGINIAGINLINDPDNKKPKQDTHFKLSGPIVAECYKVFADTWYFLKKEKINIPEPVLNHVGSAQCKLVIDGPDEEQDTIDLILIDAIVSASSSIKIMTPYFIPSREFISALNIAALSGIEVEIILPQHSDSRLADYATRNMLWELLQRGVKVYYQPGPFDHSKIFIADSEYTVIGSANIDPRSLRLNYELIIEVLDAQTLKRLDSIFAEKRELSQLISLEELEARPLLIRIRDSLCWLFSPYL